MYMYGMHNILYMHMYMYMVHTRTCTCDFVGFRSQVLVEISWSIS